MAEMVEEKVESEYSGSITKRLLTYMKPYVKQMVLSIILVLLITVFELLRPILIGDAIDTYIEGYNQPYAIVDKSDLLFQGEYLSKDLEGADSFAQLIMYEDEYYFFKDLNAQESQEMYEISQGNVRPESVCSRGVSYFVKECLKWQENCRRCTNRSRWKSASIRCGRTVVISAPKVKRTLSPLPL